MTKQNDLCKVEVEGKNESIQLEHMHTLDGLRMQSDAKIKTISNYKCL